MYLSKEEAIAKILHDKYANIQSENFHADVARVEAGEPWQYILGSVDFLGCTIDLLLRPMIPRDETAFWVKKVIEEWKDKGPVTVLDVFSGAGNIGAALLKHLPNAHVTFSELDALLLPGIKNSLVLSDIDISRAKLISGDSMSAVDWVFDIICANPPYINPIHEKELDPEMYYEPRIAFFGSDDGMAHHRELIINGKRYLNGNGAIYCECDTEQVSVLKKLLINTNWAYEFWKDPYGNDGVMVLRAQKTA